jgi:hypothetical protein
MLKKMVIALAVCAIAGPTLAQTQSKPARKLPPRPTIAEAQNDTLQMTCEQGRQQVLSQPQGIVLKTGSTRWDRYYHDAEFCGPDHLVPEFVRTKDNQACMIGYTCHTRAGDGSD